MVPAQAAAALEKASREYARLKFPTPDKAPDKESVELYFVALAITAGGVVVYHAVPSPTSAVAVLGRGRAPSFGGPDAAPGTRSPLLRLNS